MAFAPPQASSRRFFLSAAIGAWAAAALTRGAAAAGRPVVTILGDSITAGYGLAAADALPAQLQAALVRLGVNAVVRGAGVSGDTTAGGLARVDFSVQPDTSLCVVALGGNDLLQGLEPSEARANLEAIARRLKARRIKVVLCGLRAPERLNAHYARDFDAAFPAAAHETGVTFYPDLLAGVEQTAGLNQPDGIHPNPRGVKIIADHLAPLIARTLRSRA
jgi:acyl-CoA thioesterase-1